MSRQILPYADLFLELLQRAGPIRQVVSLDNLASECLTSENMGGKTDCGEASSTKGFAESVI